YKSPYLYLMFMEKVNDRLFQRTHSNYRYLPAGAKRKSVFTDYLFLAPAILYFAVFIYYPAFQAFYLSFFKYRISGNTFIGLKNYIDLFQDPHFYSESVITTLQLGLWNVGLSFVIPLFLSLLLFELHRPALQKTYQIIYYLPQLFSWAVVGGMFIIMFAPEGGIVNNFVKKFGGEPIKFMLSNRWIQPILILSSVWKTMGGTVIIYMAALFSIDPQILEASAIDGVPSIKKHFYIVIPLLKPIIVTLFVLNFTAQILMVDQGYNMVAPSVEEKGRTVMLFMLRNGYNNLRLGYAAAVSIVVFIVTFFLSILNARLTGWGKVED
ncbi:MAG: sugar ABC transporter permease, partial [Spirochaetota bacterium]